MAYQHLLLLPLARVHLNSQQALYREYFIQTNQRLVILLEVRSQTLR